MTDNVSCSQRSKIMRAIRSKGNKSTENRLAGMMSEAGIQGWQAQQKVAGSTPDFIFPGQRLAIFVDGCFWHGCPAHFKLPSNRSSYWAGKIMRNRERDLENTCHLGLSGWRSIRIWEHDLDDVAGTVDKIRLALDPQGQDWKPTSANIRHG